MEIKKGEKAGVYFAQYLHHIATGATQEEADKNLEEKLKVRGVLNQDNK